MLPPFIGTTPHLLNSLVSPAMNTKADVQRLSFVVVKAGQDSSTEHGRLLVNAKRPTCDLAVGDDDCVTHAEFSLG